MCTSAAAFIRRRPARLRFPGSKSPGKVVALGDEVHGIAIGQPVCALLAGGGYAEYAVAPAGQCLPVPDALTMVEAAAMPETLFTVWSNLFERGYAREGETVLVHGGTSGIGTMAIALCNLFGVRIIVTCGSAEKCRLAEALGADHAIDYQRQGFRRRGEADHRGTRRRDRARHGRRRLSAAQPLMPGRRRPPCHDRRPARRDRRAQHRGR